MPASFDFSQANVAASQSAVALKTNVNAATTGALDVIGFVAPWPGSIIAVTEQADTNKTAGALSVTPTINGNAIAAPADLVAVPMANAAQKAFKATDAQQTGARFAAGDLIGAKLTTDAGFTPITLDLYVKIWVIFEYVQP